MRPARWPSAARTTKASPCACARPASSVGWNFNPQYAGRGYAHEAASALFADLFTRRAARRLYAYVEDTNTSSQKLCERLGMRQEGAFKEFMSFKNDEAGAPIYENTLQYALLRHEWQRQQAG